MFVALWLGPFVEFLTRRRAPRVVAILTAYLALLGSIAFLGLVALPPIVSQIEAGVHQLPRGITSLREAVTKLITVLALAFFLLRDGPQISRRIYRIRGPDNEARLRRVGADIYHSVSGYVVGNFAISIIAGLVAYIALTVLGVAFAAPWR